MPYLGWFWILSAEVMAISSHKRQDTLPAPPQQERQRLSRDTNGIDNFSSYTSLDTDHPTVSNIGLLSPRTIRNHTFQSTAMRFP